MSLITDTWRQLVRRRLWPVALGLLVALAAVPVLLAREPEVPAGGRHRGALQAATAGAEVDPPGRRAADEAAADKGRRRVLGEARTPSRPRRAPSEEGHEGRRRRATTDATARRTAAPARLFRRRVDGSGGVERRRRPRRAGTELRRRRLDDSGHPAGVTYATLRGDRPLRRQDDEELEADIIERGEALPSEDDPAGDLPGRLQGRQARGVHARRDRDDRGRRHLRRRAPRTARPSSSPPARRSSSTSPTRTARSGRLPARRRQDPQGQGGSASSSKTAKAGLRTLRARELPYRYDARTGTVEKVGSRGLKDAAGVAAQGSSL